MMKDIVVYGNTDYGLYIPKGTKITIKWEATP